MSVEIVKVAQKRFTMECDNCETQFEYSLSDCNGLGYSFFIECPWCKQQLSHLKRIREIPKYDLQQKMISLLRDFVEEVKKEFPNNTDFYLGSKLRDCLSRKYSQIVKEIKNGDCI
jgi:hypothetical protein